MSLTFHEQTEAGGMHNTIVVFRDGEPIDFETRSKLLKILNRHGEDLAASVEGMKENA